MERFDLGFLYLVLIMARIMGLVFTLPVLNSEAVGYRMRILISFMVSIVLFPVSAAYLPPLGEGVAPFVFEVIAQAAIGMTMGFMVQIFFAAFQIAGEVFSVQLGLSFSEVLDPASQVSIPVIGTLKNMIGLLIFVAVDFPVDGVMAPALLHIFRALSYSFEAAPTLFIEARNFGSLVGYYDQAFGVMLVTALRIGIPIMGILFISTTALGILGKAAPQLNLINMGIQTNIMVGLFFVMVTLPVIFPIMTDSFALMFDAMAHMLVDWPGAGQ